MTNNATNYFDLFSLEASMQLDDAVLHTAYIEQQQRYHPDRMVGKPDQERFAAAANVANINTAYHVLKKPLTRAEHLLALNGYVVNRDGADAVTASPEILMQQMADSERLEEITSLAELQRFAAEVESRYRDLVTQVTRYAEEGTWEVCAQHTIALKYLDKLLERAKLKRKQL